MKKRVAIFGSTGSIGRSTLDVIRKHPDAFTVQALAAKSSIGLLQQQIEEFQPEIVAVFDSDSADMLRAKLPDRQILSGTEGLEEMAAHPNVDFVLLGMSGNVGLFPTISAIRAKKQIGLANKEVLISAGEWISELVEEFQVQLLPIDSEHSALFQCLEEERKESVHRLILTASGGPFYQHSLEELQKVTIEHALAHPNWSMGSKVSIDSSTLMNKGLEVIEAHYLFKLPMQKIEVIIHPQSIIHSMVEYIDGAIIAQLSQPDMKLPIQYALTYPERRQGTLKPFDFQKNSRLTFLEPDRKKFPCLQLAFDALREKKSYPCFMNAANEVLVNRFLKQQISWTEISDKLEKLMSSHSPENVLSLDAILSIDREARRLALKA